MDWKGAIEEERAALTRIVTLLGALAGLAELAGSRPPAMRGFVLWVLRRAEAAAREFVAGGADAEVTPTPVEPVGWRPADAMRLAASLRVLARQLERQARLMPGMRGADSTRTEPPKYGRIPVMRGAPHALSTLVAFAWSISHPAPDTS
jgi:hypothetical protein